MVGLGGIKRTSGLSDKILLTLLVVYGFHIDVAAIYLFIININ
jgi:hypothetical protein